MPSSSISLLVMNHVDPGIHISFQLKRIEVGPSQRRGYRKGVSTKPPNWMDRIFYRAVNVRQSIFPSLFRRAPYYRLALLTA